MTERSFRLVLGIWLAVDRAMVKAIQDVATAMNMKTVAEFVENAAILRILHEIGIDRAQGYHLGKPTPVPALCGVQPDARPVAATTPVLRLAGK